MEESTHSTAEHTELFARLRGPLLGLAYRMLGSLSEAEDVVQEAWLRFGGLDLETVQKPESYLRQIVARLCLDQLKSARSRREEYVGPWLPEPVADVESFSPASAVERSEELSFALMVALEELSPAERAALLLHDVFDASYEEVGGTLERSPEACRQLVSRARRRLRSARSELLGRADSATSPRDAQSISECERLLDAFTAAISSGDRGDLERILTAEVTLISDGGGRVLAALNPIRGRDNVMRFLLSLARKEREAGRVVDAERLLLNGEPALVVSIDGVLDQTIAVTTSVDGRRIERLFVVRNPDKLGHVGGGI